MRHSRRKLAKLFVVLLFCLAVVYLYLEDLEDLVYKNYCARSRKKVLHYDSNICLIPKIYPFDQQAMQLVKKTDRLKCVSKKQATLQGGYLIITDPNVTSISYRKVNRVPGNDFSVSLGEPVDLLNLPGLRPMPVKDEFIELKLKTADGKIYTEFLLQAVTRPGLMSRPKIDTELDLSVLIIGIDSISNGHAQRKLAKSYRFLKDTLQSYIFMGHSVVGDGTTEQLAALLTGKGERDHPEARRKKPGAKKVDDWSWVFKNAKGKGYVTSFSEDAPEVGTFQYRLVGFKNPPTDYYPRPFFIAADEYYDHANADCIGSMEIHNYHFDLARRLYEQYPNRHKFLFHFISLLSHNEFNNVGKMDDDLLNFLIEFKTKGYLNNTVLIVLGDHGWRYGHFRQTIQGKMEERLPLFAIAFPKWFKTRYPKLAKNLETNTNRLTSWFDGYATLTHLLEYPNKPKIWKHGVSLLTEVPLQRTCSDAGIPTHWCPCVLWSEVGHSHNHIQKAAMAAVDHINDLNFHEPLAKEKCLKLELGKLTYAEVETPGTAVLRFRETNDGDGFTPKYEMPVKLKNVCHYRLTFTTSPSDAIYEVNVRYLYGQFVVKKGVSRINAYGDQPKCIADTHPHLRKYCYCKAR